MSVTVNLLEKMSRRASLYFCVVLLAVLLATTPAEAEAVPQQWKPNGGPPPMLPFMLEAVLAPVWSNGGRAYTLGGMGSSPSSGSPVCIQARPLTSPIVLPLTVAELDRHFTLLYSLEHARYEDGDGGAASAAVSGVGYLSLRAGCYISLSALTDNSSTTCVGQWLSAPSQCIKGEYESLTYADTYLPIHMATTLFTQYITTYLPQRSQLRQAIALVSDLAAHTSLANADLVTVAGSSAFSDDEKLFYTQLTHLQIGEYLRDLYCPIQTEKWTTLFRLARTTLQPPPSLASTTQARCDMLDTLESWSKHPSLYSTDGLVSLVKAAMTQAVSTLGTTGGSAATVAVHGYCAVLTYVLAVTLLHDLDVLRISHTPFTEPFMADSASWGQQALSTINGKTAAKEMATLQSAVDAQWPTLLSRCGEADLYCLCLRSLLAVPSLFSGVSPSDCLRRHFFHSTATPIAWSLAADTARLAASDAEAGVARYEFVVLDSESGVEQSVAVNTLADTGTTPPRFTAQPSLFNTSKGSVTTTTTAPVDPCSSARYTQRASHARGIEHAYCPVGEYVVVGDADPLTHLSGCARCTYPCAPNEASTFCPGDGYQHLCDSMPPNAFRVPPVTPSALLESVHSACAYQCLDPYLAPINSTCTARAGSYYDSHSYGLASCRLPNHEVLPTNSSVTATLPMAVLVGSGQQDSPNSCPFVVRTRLWAVLTRPVTLPSSLLPEAETKGGPGLWGRTWSVAGTLNTTLLTEIHDALVRDGTVSSVTTTVGHELVSVHDRSNTAPPPGRGRGPVREWSWYLVTQRDSGGNAPSMKAWLLLNASTFVDVRGGYVASEAWEIPIWSETSATALTAVSYTVVVDAGVGTVTFYIGKQQLGNAVPVIWLLAASPSTVRSAQLAVTLGGRVAGYTPDSIVYIANATTGDRAPAFPQWFDFFPGMISLFARWRTSVTPTEELLTAAEEAAAATCEAELIDRAQLLPASQLVEWMSPDTSVAQVASAALVNNAALASIGFWGVCRPSSGMTKVQGGFLTCSKCPVGAYTRYSVTSSIANSVCECLPHRSLLLTTCALRSPGYTAPTSYVLESPAIVPDDVRTGGRTPAGVPVGLITMNESTVLSIAASPRSSYLSRQFNDPAAPPLAELRNSGYCTAGLASLAFTVSSNPKSTQVTAQWVAAPDTCTAQSFIVSPPRRPSSAAVATYTIAVRASSLLPEQVSVADGTLFSPGQRVLAVSIRDYVLLSSFVLRSALRIPLMNSQVDNIVRMLTEAEVRLTLTCRKTRGDRKGEVTVTNTTLSTLPGSSRSAAVGVLALEDESDRCSLVLQAGLAEGTVLETSGNATASFLPSEPLKLRLRPSERSQPLNTTLDGEEAGRRSGTGGHNRVSLFNRGYALAAAVVFFTGSLVLGIVYCCRDHAMGVPLCPFGDSEHGAALPPHSQPPIVGLNEPTSERVEDVVAADVRGQRVACNETTAYTGSAVH